MDEIKELLTGYGRLIYYEVYKKDDSECDPMENFEENKLMEIKEG